MYHLTLQSSARGERSTSRRNLALTHLTAVPLHIHDMSAFRGTNTWWQTRLLCLARTGCVSLRRDPQNMAGRGRWPGEKGR